MCRILLIDDDPTLGDVLPDILAQAGHSVDVAQDGLQALSLLRGCGSRPDLILLDLVMPGMDGPAFRREQLRDPALRAIPTVIVSARAEADAAAHHLQAAGFLPKPIELALLLGKLAGCAPA
jgi:CheY-like chemotaxis protein